MECPFCKIEMKEAFNGFECRNVLIEGRTHFFYFKRNNQPSYDFRCDSFLVDANCDRTVIYDLKEAEIIARFNYPLKFSTDIEEIVKNMMILS